ncbi:hypothetical protein HYH02_010555 [Chlamydomonas schloesseri]|uniref:EF-hand domain-containing protein n=1 Tax=Chlamydomonas schloesseri TaxID=2026947 RepID=A0A835T6F0_9CHLO|nr:hypothetical protein HYH02_010555 [Chlamydomonas schloesseri]|eukprot:KAG2439674.1 hypothetical protein HYH02_010555 [Chlamydomonas schloesseri]
MGCSDSSLKQRAEEQFFEEQRKLRQATLQAATSTRSPDVALTEQQQQHAAAPSRAASHMSHVSHVSHASHVSHVSHASRGSRLPSRAASLAAAGLTQRPDGTLTLAGADGEAGAAAGKGPPSAAASRKAFQPLPGQADGGGQGEDEADEKPAARVLSKVTSGVLSGSLNVGNLFRAALEDTCELALTAETLPRIVEVILTALDKDANGTIEVADLKKFIQTVCREAELQVPPDEQVVAVFRELDIDGDGSISRAELAAVMFRWFIVGVC